jgi:hypothetical protein
LLFDGRQLQVDVTAEVPVAVYPPGAGPDPARVAGVDLGVIHPYAVAGPGGQQLLVSGRAIRVEHRQHLRDVRARRRAAAGRAPARGQRSSRGWRQHRHGVTRGAVPHHGPPKVTWPAPARPAPARHGKSLAPRRGARKHTGIHRRTYGQVH